MKSWQIFHYARKTLPEATLLHIFSPRHARTIRYWAANPRYAKSYPNPIDRVRAMLEELSLAGYGHVSRAAVDLIAEPVGGRFAYLPDAETDRHSVDGELVDVTVAVGRLAAACREAMADDVLDDDERGKLIELMRSVRRELDQLLDALEEHAQDITDSKESIITGRPDKPPLPGEIIP